MWRQLPSEPIYVSTGLFSQSSLLASDYLVWLFSQVIVHLLLISRLTRHNWHAMNAAEKEVFSSIFTKHVCGHILRGAFGAICAKKIRNKIVVSKPTTINYRRSIKLSDSDFFWSFIFTSSDQMFNLRLLVRKGLEIEITLEKKSGYNGQW